VLELLFEGKTNAELAQALGISVAGVRWQVSELLGETGLQDRQALAAWWREERERRHQPGLIPARLQWPRLTIAATLAATAVLLVVGWLLFTRDGGGRTAQPLVEQSAVDEGFLSGGPIRPFEPLFENFLVELTVEAGSGESRVDLRDVRTGGIVGSVDAGYRPMVLVRRNAAELLVSSGIDRDTDKGFRKVTQVYDLRGYSLELKRTIETPDRINCTTYCQPMVLSRDEQYVYYGARTTAPECGAGGDASVCDVHSVVRIDLDGAGATETVELRRGCGVPILAAAGESGALVVCRGQYPVNGGWATVIEPGAQPRILDFATSRLQVAHVTAAGEVLVIGEGGAVIKEDAQGRRTTANALPTGLGFGTRVFYYGSLDLGDDRLFLVFDNADFGSHDRKYGFVVFDTRAMQIEGHGRVPEALTYLPNGDSIYVLRDGRIDVLDLTTGRLSLLSDSVGRDVEVLLPGK
jgi:hypothetical protein